MKSMYPASGSKDKETTILDPTLESSPPWGKGGVEQTWPLITLVDYSSFIPCYPCAGWNLERLCSFCCALLLPVKMVKGYICAISVQLRFEVDWKKIENRSLKSDPKTEPQALLKRCLVSEFLRLCASRFTDKLEATLSLAVFKTSSSVLWNLNNWVNWLWLKNWGTPIPWFTIILLTKIATFRLLSQVVSLGDCKTSKTPPLKSWNGHQTWSNHIPSRESLFSETH